MILNEFGEMNSWIFFDIFDSEGNQHSGDFKEQLFAPK
jgi:hypothetical protein